MVRKRYIKKYGLCKYSSSDNEIIEFLPKTPICPNGHKINEEPYIDLEDLDPIFKSVEQFRDWPPGFFMAGRVVCGAGCGERCINFDAGWHICERRASGNCDYMMQCTNCYMTRVHVP